MYFEPSYSILHDQMIIFKDWIKIIPVDQKISVLTFGVEDIRSSGYSLP